MGLLISIFFGFAPMFLYAAFIYWLDRYEKEPLLLLGGVFIWGAVVAAGGAYVINSTLGIGVFLVTGSQGITTLTSGSLIAPIIEEGLKGFAVLLVFVFFHSEFDSILDGIVYASVAALGFAATENSFYIFSQGFQKTGWAGLGVMVFIRTLLVGFQHPFYTAFFGIGLAYARLNKNITLKVLAPAGGLLTAILFHSIHNTLVVLNAGPLLCAFGILMDWSGCILMLFFTLWMVTQEQSILSTYLKDEIGNGTMTPILYKSAISTWRQTSEKFQSIGTSRYRTIDRYYSLCGELAHKKRQLECFGEEQNNHEIIAALRSEMKDLLLII